MGWKRRGLLCQHVENVRHSEGNRIWWNYLGENMEFFGKGEYGLVPIKWRNKLTQRRNLTVEFR